MKYKGRTLRHELKYMINQSDYIQLKSRLETILTLDKNAVSKGSYHIRSLYFDDQYNRAYHEKEDGVFARTKFRIRIYNFSDEIIRLEKKEKFDSYISKVSTTISKEMYHKILAGKLTHLDVIGDELLTEFYAQVKVNRLRPRIIVDYERIPFTHKHGNVRITFDKSLKTVLNNVDILRTDTQIYSVIGEEQMILEVKFDDYLPKYIREVLTLHHHQHMSASKFVMCCEADLEYNWKEHIQ